MPAMPLTPNSPNAMTNLVRVRSADTGKMIAETGSAQMPDPPNSDFAALVLGRKGNRSESSPKGNPDTSVDMIDGRKDDGASFVESSAKRKRLPRNDVYAVSTAQRASTHGIFPDNGPEDVTDSSSAELELANKARMTRGQEIAVSTTPDRNSASNASAMERVKKTCSILPSRDHPQSKQGDPGLDKMHSPHRRDAPRIQYPPTPDPPQRENVEKSRITPSIAQNTSLSESSEEPHGEPFSEMVANWETAQVRARKPKTEDNRHPDNSTIFTDPGEPVLKVSSLQHRQSQSSLNGRETTCRMRVQDYRESSSDRLSTSSPERRVVPNDLTPKANQEKQLERIGNGHAEAGVVDERTMKEDERIGTHEAIASKRQAGIVNSRGLPYQDEPPSYSGHTGNNYSAKPTTSSIHSWIDEGKNTTSNANYLIDDTHAHRGAKEARTLHKSNQDRHFFHKYNSDNDKAPSPQLKSPQTTKKLTSDGNIFAADSEIRGVGVIGPSRKTELDSSHPMYAERPSDRADRNPSNKDERALETSDGSPLSDTDSCQLVPLRTNPLRRVVKPQRVSDENSPEVRSRERTIDQPGIYSPDRAAGQARTELEPSLNVHDPLNEQDGFPSPNQTYRQGGNHNKQFAQSLNEPIGVAQEHKNASPAKIPSNNQASSVHFPSTPEENTHNKAHIYSRERTLGNHLSSPKSGYNQASTKSSDVGSDESQTTGQIEFVGVTRRHFHELSAHQESKRSSISIVAENSDMASGWQRKLVAPAVASKNATDEALYKIMQNVRHHNPPAPQGTVYYPMTFSDSKSSDIKCPLSRCSRT